MKKTTRIDDLDDDLKPNMILITPSLNQINMPKS